MAGSLLERAMRTLEVLAREADGVSLQEIADEVVMPKSGVHRLLHELTQLGFTRQDPVSGRYVLTTKLLSLGYAYLASSGMVDIAQPVLNRLAQLSGELVRLTVVDGDCLTWVAKAQGARSGLRYDPEMGQHPTLFCTASGLAWLATLDDETALQITARQGFGRLNEHGPNAPRTVSALVKLLNLARRRGYAFVQEAAAVGTSAIAVAVLQPQTNRALGTISVAGPIFRLTEAKSHQLAPELRAAALELSRVSAGSEFLIAASRAAAQ